MLRKKKHMGDGEVLKVILSARKLLITVRKNTWNERDLVQVVWLADFVSRYINIYRLFNTEI